MQTLEVKVQELTDAQVRLSKLNEAIKAARKVRDKLNKQIYRLEKKLKSARGDSAVKIKANLKPITAEHEIIQGLISRLLDERTRIDGQFAKVDGGKRRRVKPGLIQNLEQEISELHVELPLKILGYSQKKKLLQVAINGSKTRYLRFDRMTGQWEGAPVAGDPIVRYTVTQDHLNEAHMPIEVEPTMPLKKQKKVQAITVTNPVHPNVPHPQIAASPLIATSLGYKIPVFGDPSIIEKEVAL